jgi:hypothetical protein
MLRKFFCVVLLAFLAGGMLTGQIQGAKRRATWRIGKSFPRLARPLQSNRKAAKAAARW